MQRKSLWSINTTSNLIFFMSYQKLLFITVFIGLSVGLRGQQTNYPIRQYLENELKKNAGILFPESVREFYGYAEYRFAWLNDETAMQQLSDYIEHAGESGLNKEDYQIRFIKSVQDKTAQLQSIVDSLAAEIRFTDCAIHFFSDIAFGREPALLKYNGLNYAPNCIDVPALVAAALNGHLFNQLLPIVEDQSPEYLALKKMAASFVSSDSLQTGAIITSSNPVTGNKPLLQKLYQLGIINSPDFFSTDTSMKNYLKQAQRMFYLPENGYLSSALIKELNVPLAERQSSLHGAMNTLRWLSCIRKKWPHIVVVNIPSASLLVYAGDSVSLASRLIVGKYSTQTPTLCSTINEVILYPYWNVPAKMAATELLPMIKKDKTYLSDNNFQVLNKQGRLVDAATVNWQKLNAKYFPYTLRQSTGCDNSLGIVKFNFNSPFDVYLHDTPWKILFNLNTRFFSHGCMRLQKSVELAHLLLRDNSIAIDTLVSKGCVNNQHPIILQVAEKMPVFVLYQTAWVDSAATVRFYDDVYRKFKRVRK